MGFWDVLDDGTLLGKCETNFFHIYIYNDIPNLDFWDYEDSLKGTFMHEYLHYIQFVNTMFGISHGILYSNYYSYCVKHFQENDEIRIPLSIRSQLPDLELLTRKYELLKGSSSISIEIDRIMVEPDAIELARIGGVPIDVKGINSLTEESENFQFGYKSIVENMAVIFQAMFDSNLREHPLVPYHTVELILNSQPEPITDKKLIFSISLCSLMFSNPAVAFFDLLKVLEGNPDYDGIKLYKHVLGSRVYHPLCNTLADLFCQKIDEYRSHLEAAIKNELVYFSKVFENCKSEILNGESFLLRLLYDSEVNSKTFITNLTNHYGLPLIEAQNLILMPRSPDPEVRDFLDIANLRSLELVINRFTSSNRKCQMYHKCYKLLYADDGVNRFDMSAECEDEQWKKEEDCLMSISMRKYKLHEKTIIQGSY